MQGFIHGRCSQFACGHRSALALALVAAFSLGTAAEAVAASNVPPQVSGTKLDAVETERAALFKQMLADPGNVKLALRYAELSSQAGDLEGAISTLERLLIFAPDVAELNYQLGILYMRLGAFGQASADFKAAAAAPDATPEIKAAAANYLAVADRQVVGDYTTGSVAFGMRYQTNANGGAQNSTVSLNGIQFQLNQAAMADPDYNAYISSVLHASHDLADQGDRIDLNANFYGSLYRKRGDLNTVALEVGLGPVFDLQRFSIKNTTLGIYGIASAVGLESSLYLYTFGAGINVAARVTPTTTFGTRFEYRQETYVNSPNRPSVASLTGPRMRLTESAEAGVSDWLSFYSSVYGERKIGQTGLQSDWQGGGTLGAKLSFGDKAQPVTIDLSAGLSERLYDAADPVISTVPRLDKTGYVQGTLSLPLPKGFSAVASAAYSKQISNYDLYTFDNISASLALTKNF